MKTLRLAVVIGALACALPGAWAARTPEAAAVLEADRSRLDAMIAGDAAALDAALAADCLYVHSYGAAQTKAEFVGAFRQRSLAYRRLAYLGEPAVRVHGGDTAILTGRMEIEVVDGQGRTHKPTLLVTAVYVRDGVHWKLASYQSTTAAETAR